MVYDVIVSGVGPAGASFLKSVEGFGLKVLALEKSEFPRKKLCAGGLTPKAYRLLKSLFPEVDSAVRVRTRRFLLFNDTRRVEIDSGEVLTYLTDRTELDNLLFRSLSADVHEGEGVVSVEREGELWRVRTEKGSYLTRVLVAADGVNSRIAAQLKVNRDVGFTYEADVKNSRGEEIVVDFSGFSWGYYWLFPKGDFVTAGLGEFKDRRKIRTLKEVLEKFNRKHGVKGEVLHKGGFPIPCGRRRNDVCRESLIFLGDAGGLVDPLTGEGIYYAVKSGIYGAEVVKKSFEKGDFALLSLYKELIDRDFGREFFWARIVGKLFFPLKGLNFSVIEKSAGIAELTAKLLSGEISYFEGIKSFFSFVPKALLKG